MSMRNALLLAIPFLPFSQSCTFEVPEATKIVISGIDKELVGQVAAGVFHPVHGAGAARQVRAGILHTGGRIAGEGLKGAIVGPPIPRIIVVTAIDLPHPQKNIMQIRIWWDDKMVHSLSLPLQGFRVHL